MRIETSKARWALLAAAIVLFIAAARPAAAQNRPQPQIKPPAASGSEAAPAPMVLVDSTEDYKIGPRDVIDVKIDDAEELSKSFEVRADGTFLMSYLGRVKAAGRTPDALARFIEDGLRGSYLKNPHVSVVVKQFNSHTFLIQGSVFKPGAYQIEGRPSLFTLISVAGGLADNHGSTAFIIREIKKRPAESANKASGSPDDDSEDAREFTVKTANIGGLLKGKLGQNNVILEPGDTVSIPKADLFYVVGEVNASGSFPLSDGMTVRQALALAQGTTPNAKAGDSSIMRTDDSGKFQEIKVDLDAVLKNKTPDVVLQANDMIIVPNSRGKTVMNNLLKAFGIGAAQRGVYRY